METTKDMEKGSTDKLERFLAAIFTDYWSARERTLPELLEEMEDEDPDAILAYALGRFENICIGVYGKPATPGLAKRVERVLAPHTDRFPYLILFAHNVRRRAEENRKGKPEENARKNGNGTTV